MVSVEKTAKSVEKAIQLALKELKVARDKVSVDVLENSSKGLMGIFSGKSARVKVTINETLGEKAKIFLEQVLDKMRVSAIVDVKEENEELIKLEIHGKNMGIIIGHRGQTLDSLQYLASLVVNKGRDKYKKIILDTENYRKKREQALIKLADKLAQKVKKTKRRVILEPMNPYERRILHFALQNHEFVKTHSEGDEPNRKVIITAR